MSGDVSGVGFCSTKSQRPEPTTGAESTPTTGAEAESTPDASSSDVQVDQSISANDAEADQDDWKVKLRSLMGDADESSARSALAR